MVIKTFIS